MTCIYTEGCKEEALNDLNTNLNWELEAAHVAQPKTLRFPRGALEKKIGPSLQYRRLPVSVSPQPELQLRTLQLSTSMASYRLIRHLLPEHIIIFQPLSIEFSVVRLSHVDTYHATQPTLPYPHIKSHKPTHKGQLTQFVIDPEPTSRPFLLSRP
jgi:hypothetical protein